MTEYEKLENAIATLETMKKQFLGETRNVIDVAIKALEKQIPKKPLFGTVHNDITYYCSNCKKFISFYDTRIYEYCHNCGQKLDWQTKIYESNEE